MSIPHISCWHIVAFSFFVTGCAVSGVIRVGIPSDFKGDVAVVRASGAAGLANFLSDGEAHTTVKSIDGSVQAAEYVVAPGKHSIDLFMTHTGVSFLGTAIIDIPTPERYVVRGRRRGAVFEVALVREDGQANVAATLKANRLEGPLYIPVQVRR